MAGRAVQPCEQFQPTRNIVRAGRELDEDSLADVPREVVIVRDPAGDGMNEIEVALDEGTECFLRSGSGEIIKQFAV